MAQRWPNSASVPALESDRAGKFAVSILERSIWLGTLEKYFTPKLAFLTGTKRRFAAKTEGR